MNQSSGSIQHPIIFQPPNQFQPHHHDRPILSRMVLNIVFNLLDMDDLKTCRQVCHRWDEQAVIYLLKKCAVYLKAENVSQLADIERWINCGKISKFRFSHFKCDSVTHDTYKNIWPVLGTHVRSFEVSHWWGDDRDLSLGDYEDLLIYGCPRLEEIVMPCTRKFLLSSKFLKKAAYLYHQQEQMAEGNEEVGQIMKKRMAKFRPLNLKTIKVTGIGRPGHGFWRIVTLSPNLKALSLSCRLPENIWSIDKSIGKWNERLANLEFSETRSYANEATRERGVAAFQERRDLKCRTLIYENYELDDTWMKRISELLQDTLETLHVILFNRQDVHFEEVAAEAAEVADQNNYEDRRGMDWMTSSKLTKLKTYKLEIDEQCAGPIFCKALVHAMLLPNLETLSLSTYEDGGNGAEWPEGLFNQIFLHIIIQNFKNEQITVRPSLKALTLPPLMRDTSCIRPIHEYFPNLVELTLNFPSETMLVLIFLHWTQLQRLSLRLSTEEGKINWQDILMGSWHGGQDATMISQQVRNDLIFGKISGQTAIYNLIHLKSLDIQILPTWNGKGQLAYPLQDIFLQEGLAPLQQTLQHVSIEGHEFSQCVVNWLRLAWLPYCHIDFK